jgi:hypothetical protein
MQSLEGSSFAIPSIILAPTKKNFLVKPNPKVVTLRFNKIVKQKRQWEQRKRKRKG